MRSPRKIIHGLDNTQLITRVANLYGGILEKDPAGWWMDMPSSADAIMAVEDLRAHGLDPEIHGDMIRIKA